MEIRNVFSAAALFLVTASVVRAEWGMNVALNHWEMDADELDREVRDMRNNPGFAPGTGQVRENSIGGEIGGFYERSFREGWSWGVGLGFSRFPTAKLSESYTSGATFMDTSVRVQHQAMSFPLGAYVRRTPAAGPWSWTGGAGVELIKASVDYNDSVPGGSTSGRFRDEKVAFFLRAGGDHKVTPSLSLSFALKYLFSAELDRFKGSVAGLSPGKHRLIMRADPPYGEFIGFTNSGLSPGRRPYKVDFGGLRLTAGARLTFGGRRKDEMTQ